jgi:hypothetical protein
MKSIYRFLCECGLEIESETTTGECRCGRLFDVSAWRSDPVVVKGEAGCRSNA